MKYIVEDLDYIFIRAKNKEGKWDSLNLNQITDKQFIYWLKKRLDFDVTEVQSFEKPITPKEKVYTLNFVSKNMCGGEPCVVMIKREARNK